MLPLDEKLLRRACDAVIANRGVMEVKHVPHDNALDYMSLYNLVDRHLCVVGGDKTPGYPLNLQYGNNAKALESEYDSILLASVARLHMWLDPDVPFDKFSESPTGLVRSGLVDPSSVFIKDEPHPSRKHINKKYRCINPVSLVDQMVEASLFSDSSARLKERLFENGSAVGVGFTDEQTLQFTNFVKHTESLYGSTTSADIGGYDAIHTPQTLKASVYVDSRTHHNPNGLDHWNLANYRWSVACSHSVVVVDGHLYCKLQPGMINSGSRDTSRRNSLLRVLYSHLFAFMSDQRLDHSLANGDDGLDWGITDLDSYVRAASDVGVTLRDCIQTHGENFEFCSHEYDYSTGEAQLLTWKKAIYRILSVKGLSLTDAMQFAAETRHNPEHSRIVDFINSLGLPLTA